MADVGGRPPIRSDRAGVRAAFKSRRRERGYLIVTHSGLVETFAPEAVIQVIRGRMSAGERAKRRWHDSRPGCGRLGRVAAGPEGSMNAPRSLAE